MMTYLEAEATFAKARNKAAGKFLQGNTRLIHLENGDYAVLFHQTNVVTIHADGSYTLRNDGHWTKTTKERINQYSPVHIWQKKGDWFIWFSEKVSIPFYDGIRIIPGEEHWEVLEVK